MDISEFKKVITNNNNNKMKKKLFWFTYFKIDIYFLNNTKIEI